RDAAAGADRAIGRSRISRLAACRHLHQPGPDLDRVPPAPVDCSRCGARLLSPRPREVRLAACGIRTVGKPARRLDRRWKRAGVMADRARARPAEYKAAGAAAGGVCCMRGCYAPESVRLAARDVSRAYRTVEPTGHHGVAAILG